MWPFKDKTKTDIKLLVTDYIGGVDTMPVYDVGNGPYILTRCFKTPRYLAKDGKFETNYRKVNGDAESWRAHIGDPSTLNWSNGSEA